MGGTWFDWLIVLIGSFLLLPRLFGYAFNTLIMVRLRTEVEQRFGMKVHGEFGSISLRALSDIHLYIERCRLLPPPLQGVFASCQVSIENLRWTLFQSKPIMAQLNGARIVIRLEDETEQERKIREEREAEKGNASRSVTPTTISEDDPAHPPHPSSSSSTTPASDSSVDSDCDTISVGSFSHRCILKLIELFGISLHHIELCVQKGDIQVSIMVGLNLWFGDGITELSRQLHTDLTELTLRVEQISTHTAFRTKQEYKSLDDDKWRMPPLLAILPTDIALDLRIQRCRPCGIAGIDVGCGGIEAAIDPTNHLQAMKLAIAELDAPIRAIMAASSISSTAPSVRRKYSSEQRRNALRFLPKQTKLSIAHLKIELVQRDEGISQLLNRENYHVALSLRHRTHAKTNKRGGLPCSFAPPPMVLPDSAYIPYPIQHLLVVRCNKIQALSAVKTTFPVYDQSAPPEDNNISSIDWSLNMSGPSIWMSQQGLVYPRLDVEYCKLTGHSSANAASTTVGAPTGTTTTRPGKHFPITAPLHASAGVTSAVPSGGMTRTSKRSNSNLSRGHLPTDFHPVESLFHPTTAFRPQTVHSLTFVVVSLRAHVFPPSADWSRYIVHVVEKVTRIVETIPKKVQHHTIHSSTMRVQSIDEATVKSPMSPTSASPPSIIPIHQKFGSINSPDSYLRQINCQQRSGLASPYAGLASPSISAAIPFPQFPFSNHLTGVDPSVIPPSAASTLAAARTSNTTIATPNAPINTIREEEANAGDHLPHAHSHPHADEEDNPYAVRTALTINAKVVDLHLAVYSKMGDILPLCHLSLSEVSLRFDSHPPQHGLTVDPRRLTSAARGGSDRIEVVISGFVGSMPQDGRNPYALAIHPNETLQTPGQFWQLNSATLIIDLTQREMMFTADGLTIRWSSSVLLMGPTLVGLGLAHLPEKSPAESTRTHAPPTGDPIIDQTASEPVEEEVPIKSIHGTITNVTIDFPYVLEFKSDPPSGSPSPVNSPADDAILNQLSPAVPTSRRLNPNPVPSSSSSSAPPPSPLPPLSASAPSPASTTSTSPSASAASFSTAPSPSSEPYQSARGEQLRPTALFTYKSPIINLDVDIPKDTWTVLLYQSNLLSEGETFLTLLNSSLTGNERSATRPKGMYVTGDQIIGSWRPALQLGIFKIVKDNVAAAINFKYMLCQVIPSWRWCIDPTLLSGKMDDVDTKVLHEMDAFFSNPSRLHLDYDTDPMLRLFDTKNKFLSAFKQWYHHQRAKYLPEPFMHVTLNATNLLFDASLNRQETLGCTIRVDRFASDYIHSHFIFAGVEIDFMKKRLISVREVQLNRVGLPNLANVRASRESSAIAHPLLHFTEEHHLLANYLDISLEFKDVLVEIAPSLEIGGVIDLLLLKLQALLAGIFDLPSLDTLSRRRSGPGYRGPPSDPPPAVIISITQCKFQLVDEPAESWLQHLHLLWLDERAEQERRRALLRLKMEQLQKERSRGQPTTQPPDSTFLAIEANLSRQLNEWNSRSYITRVEKLKKSFRGSDSLRKGPLLNLTITSMLMSMGFEGEHGNFYDDDSVLKVIRNRKQAEEEGWAELARRRSKQEAEEHSQCSATSRSGTPLESRSTSSVNASPGLSAAMASDIPDELLLPSSGSSDSLTDDANRVGPKIGFLSARYFNVSLSEIEVKLRNFPLPLFSCLEASLHGHAALVQIKHAAAAPASATPPLTCRASVPHHSRESSAPIVTSGERAAVSIGGVHTVAVEKKYRPFQMFYDIEGNVNQASIAFSPCFLYTLRDIYDAMNRIIPPLPELYPIQPIPGMIGLGSLGLATARKKSPQDERKSASPPVIPTQHQEIDPVNYIHLFRGITHGRFRLSIKDTEVKLLASNDPYESTRFLRLQAGLCQLSFEKSIFKVSVQQIHAIQIPARPKQPFLVELPQLELHTTVLWICTEVPIATKKKTIPKPNQSPVPMTNRARHMSMIPMRHGALVDPIVGSKDGAAGAPSFTLPAPSVPLNAPTATTNTAETETGETQHVCTMHLSISLYFSSHHPYPGPLSVTLHAGSLASLVQFAQVYSAIPPLPFPRRMRLKPIHSGLSPIISLRSLDSHAPTAMSYTDSPITPTRTMTTKDAGHSIYHQDDDQVKLEPLRLPVGGADAATSTTQSSSMPAADPSHSSVSAPSASPPAPSSRPAWRPQPLKVELHGLYLERILLEKIHVTIWEGADLGPARGLRLSMEQVYLALELQEEGVTTAFNAEENLKSDKCCFPFKKVNIEQQFQSHSSPNRSPVSNVSSLRILRDDSSIDSSRVSGVSRVSSGSSSSTDSKPSQMIIWSLSNAVVGISKLYGRIVYNERWREMADQESEVSEKIDSIFRGSRVVAYYYENQRYTLGLGWSNRNLLPTDRGPFTNADGSQKLLREDMKLPSDDWEWENDWHLDFHLRRSGEVDEEGWEYAHDFPRKYSRVRTWYCNVRRRRWIRVRKLKAIAISQDERHHHSNESSNSNGRRGGPNSEDNFVLSLARITIQQKQSQHGSDLAMLMLDRERGLFRTVTAPIFSKAPHNARSPKSPSFPASNGGTVEISTARRHSLSRSKSTSDTFTAQSLLNFFKIPVNSIGGSIPSPVPVTGHVHNVHRLSEQEFHDAQMVQEELKRLHATTSSIVTVGGGMGMNPTFGARIEDANHDGQPKERGVRFNQECVLDSRRRDLNLSNVAMSSTTSLCRSDLASVHSIRLYDFKILLTIEIRSTLVTLIDQYVTTIVEIVQKARDSKNQAKYAATIHGGEQDMGLDKLKNKSMMQILEDGSLCESDGPSLADADGDSMRESIHSLSTTPELPVSPRSESRSASTDSAWPNDASDELNAATKSLRTTGVSFCPPRGSMVSMDDFLRDEDTEVDYYVEDLQSARNAKRPRALSIVARPQAEGIQSNANNVTTQEEVHELFLLEVINPQLNVHSEETRGRILVAIQKLSIHGRVHFKSTITGGVTTTISATSASAVRGATGASPNPNSTPNPASSTARTRAGTDLSSRATVTSPPRGITGPPKFDKLHVSVMIDQLQAFVAPTDVDVDAGVIWFSSSTAGILKAIMEPSSFVCTVCIRPGLAAFLKPTQVESNGTMRSDSPNSSSSGSRSSSIPDSSSPHISKATQHMSSNHQVGASVSSSRPSAELHSIDINLPGLVLAMDSYQFALVLDVLKTVTSPLPIQTIDQSVGLDDNASEANTDGDGGASSSSSSSEDDEEELTLEELKARAHRTKAGLTVLEWEMRYIEWILSGLTSSAFKPTQTYTPSSSGGSSSSSSSSSSTNSAVQSMLDSSDPLTPSYSSWLVSTTSMFHRPSTDEPSDGSDDIQTKFHDLLKEHSRQSNIFLKHVLKIRLKKLEQKQPVQPQNIAITVFLDGIRFNLRKQEKNFLSLYLDGVHLAAHLYDDASADLALEVASFGARNTMAAYTNPNNKEYQWAEMVQPIKLSKDKSDKDYDVGKDVDRTSTGSRRVGGTAENIHSSEMLISIHGVKREEFNMITNQSTIIFQHLEVNIYPLQVKVTYDTLTALIEFFIEDQSKFHNHNDSTSDTTSSAAALKNKKEYSKYKSKFLPGGSHILEQDATMIGIAGTSMPPIAVTGMNAAGKGKRGILESIKHSRVISVAKEFYHAHATSTHPQLQDLYDHDLTSPSHPSSLASPRSRQIRSSSDDSSLPTVQFDGIDGPALSNMSMTGIIVQKPTTTSMTTTTTSNDASKKKKKKKRSGTLVSKKKERVYHFVYIRFGSTLVDVSYWGNKQNNIEDFQGLRIRFRQILFQKRRWTMKHFLEHIKKEGLKNLLSQVSSTLGSFISYKLGLRPATTTTTTTMATAAAANASATSINDIATNQPAAHTKPAIVVDSERTAQAWIAAHTKETKDGLDSDDDVDDVSAFDPNSSFRSSPDSSALLAHFDAELAGRTSSNTFGASIEDETAVRSILFGVKKSKSSKLVDAMMQAIMPGKEKEKEKEKASAATAASSSAPPAATSKPNPTTHK